MAKRERPALVVLEVLLSGVSGGDDYLVKPFDPNELLVCVRRPLPAPLAGGDTARKLTRRELEVLSLLVEGLSQPEIAEKLFISPMKVGKHIEHILAKLGIHSRAQAVALAVRDELIETHPAQDVTASFTRSLLIALRPG